MAKDALPDGMKPWSGGVDQPDDYRRGGRCLTRHGLIVCAPLQQDWRHVTPRDAHSSWEVTAYTPDTGRK